MASVRPNKSGTFSVLYRVGKRQTSLTFPTQKSAEDFRALVDLLGPEKALKTLTVADDADQLSVSELAEKFLTWKARDVTERTLRDYRRDVDNWIVPWLGHRNADLVDERDVQEWVDHMASPTGGKLSPKSVADRHMLLHSIYAYGRAKSRGLVGHNPCLETELPKRTKKPPKGSTVPEFRAILEAAAVRNPAARDLIEFMGETGWRWSEAASLPVRVVEDDGVDVFVTVDQVFRVDAGGRQYVALDEAKSYAAFRRIRLLPDSAATVRRRVVGRAPNDLVFLNSRGRAWNQNTFLRETWPSITKAAGLRADGDAAAPGERRITPHWLRHMHVAVLAAAGVPMQEIQRRIGHESIQTTINVYGGMIGDLSDDSLGKVTAIMAGHRRAPGVAPGDVVAGELVD